MLKEIFGKRFFSTFFLTIYLGQMLLVDPTQRPKINSIYGELSDLATARNVPAFDSIIFNEDIKRRMRNYSKPKGVISFNFLSPNDVDWLWGTLI